MSSQIITIKKNNAVFSWNKVNLNDISRCGKTLNRKPISFVFRESVVDRYVLKCEVLGVQKRCYPYKKYLFIFLVQWSDERYAAYHAP